MFPPGTTVGGFFPPELGGCTKYEYGAEVTVSECDEVFVKFVLSEMEEAGILLGIAYRVRS